MHRLVLSRVGTTLSNTQPHFRIYISVTVLSISLSLVVRTGQPYLKVYFRIYHGTQTASTLITPSYTKVFHTPTISQVTPLIPRTPGVCYASNTFPSTSEKHRILPHLLPTTHKPHRCLRKILPLSPDGQPLLHELQRCLGEDFSFLPMFNFSVVGKR